MNPLTPFYGYIAAGLLIILIVACGGGYRYGHKHASATAKVAMSEHLAADQKAAADHRDKLRSLEQDLAAAQAAVSDAYEKGKRDAEALEKAVVADLRAGNLRLQKRWSGCEASRMPSPTPSTSEPDATSRDRAESAGRIVRAAAQCDAQVRELQQLVTTWRTQINRK